MLRRAVRLPGAVAKVSAVWAATACCALTVGPGSAVAGTVALSSSPAAASGTWGSAENVPGLLTLNTLARADINSVSCPAAGDCGAGGFYDQHGGAGGRAFVVSAVNGTWGTAQQVSGLPALNTAGYSEDDSVTSVSCASPGNCGAGGFYGMVDDSNFLEYTQAFVVSEVNGIWGTAQEVPGTAALNTGDAAQVTSVSCTSAGNCAAGGFYTGSSGVAFVVDETSGTWGTAQEVPGTTTSEYSQIRSVSCTSPGDCGAVGDIVPGGGVGGGTMVVNETAGTWGTAEEVPGSAKLSTNGNGSTSVSCASAGNCSAVGWYDPDPDGSEALDDQAFVVDETDGTWGTEQEVPGTSALNVGGAAEASSVSCASPGSCSLGGYYSSSVNLGGTDYQQAFVADETDGAWDKAAEVPGTATLNARGWAQITSVSCPSAGNCSAGGLYTDADFNRQAFVVDETDGTWGKAQEVPGTAALNAGGAAQVTSVSCPSAGNCSAGGFYTADVGQQAFVVNKSVTEPTSTTMTLSEPKVTYGDEQAEKVSVTVSAGSGESGGTPSGTVSVRSGGTAVCAITLASGKGSCALTGRKLTAGAHHLVASYGASAGFAASTSAAKTLTVSKATSRTKLTLSSARVTYGKEQTEHLTVTVTPQYSGTPGGKVTIKAGNTTVCTITLGSGKGSCRPPRRKLPVGRYTLVAAYPASADFSSSTSAKSTLTVVR
jgi:hypothetical protein